MESKEQFNTYYQRVSDMIIEIGLAFSKKISDDKNVSVQVFFDPRKDYSSTDLNYEFNINIKKKDNVSSRGRLEAFLEDVKLVKEFMEEELEYYFDDIKFSEDYLIAMFMVSRENVDKHPLFKSMMGLDKYNIK